MFMSFEPHDPVTAGPLSVARKDADCAAHDPLACEPAILRLYVACVQVHLNIFALESTNWKTALQI